MPNFGTQRILNFEFQCQKLLRLYCGTYMLLFCIDLSPDSYGVYDLIEHISRYFKICQ